MDHQTALKSQAVERYTLGELTSSQREEFEAHYFTCAECAAALREYEIFSVNARAVFQDQDQQAQSRRVVLPPKRNWRDAMANWLGVRTLIPAAAAFALAFGVVTFLRPSHAMPDPAGEASQWVLAADARDEIPHHAIRSSTVWLEPQIDLVTGMNPNRWAKYHWEVRDASGALVEQADGVNGAGQLTLKLPASKFAPGQEYRLTVQGASGTSPLESTFIIDRK